MRAPARPHANKRIACTSQDEPCARPRVLMRTSVPLARHRISHARARASLDTEVHHRQCRPHTMMQLLFLATGLLKRFRRASAFTKKIWQVSEYRHARTSFLHALT